ARAEDGRQFTPRIAAGLARASDGLKLPDQLAVVRVVGADEALFVFAIRLTATDALNDFAVVDDGSARGAVVALRTVAHGGLPELFAVASIKRHQVRVGRGQNDFVLVDRNAALCSGVRVGAVLVFPDEVAGPRVQRLQDVAGVVQVHHAVVDDGRGLIGAG